MTDQIQGFESREAPADRLASGLNVASRAIRRSADVPVWSITSRAASERLSDALRLRAPVDELVARLVGGCVEAGVPTSEGASSPRAWLMSSYRLSRRAASQLVGQAAAAMTPRTEALRQAWAAGDLTSDQAATAARAMATLSADLPPDLVRQAESHLIEHKDLPHADYQVLAHRVIEIVDPKGADAKLGELLEAEEARAWQLATFRRRRVGDGTSRVSGRLPDLYADMLDKALEAASSPRRVAARTAGPPTGDDASLVFDIEGEHADTEIGVLTYSQRQGRALCELIQHLDPAALPQHGGVNATVVVTLPYDQLVSQLGDATLDTGTSISAGQARLLACNAKLLPAVLGGDSHVLDLGMSKRLFDRYQRQALAVRDRGCVWPGCDRPPAWCESHHLTQWLHGGPTDVANGCLLCGFHHRLLHTSDWAVVMAADGTCEIVPPTRIDPDQRPRRNARFRAPPG